MQLVVAAQAGPKAPGAFTALQAPGDGEDLFVSWHGSHETAVFAGEEIWRLEVWELGAFTGPKSLEVEVGLLGAMTTTKSEESMNINEGGAPHRWCQTPS